MNPGDAGSNPVYHLMDMIEAMNRIFVVSYECNYWECVNWSDVNKIVKSSRMYPNSKVYCYVPGWTDDSRVFVLADDQKHAIEIYSCWMGQHTPKDIKESDFKDEDIELED